MLKGFVNEKKDFIIPKETLESLILCHIFSNLNQNKNRKICAGNGFANLFSDKNDNCYITLEYKVFVDYNFDDGSEDHFNHLIQYTLGGKNEYTRKECEEIAKELYLKSPNDVAIILKILNSEVKFI